MDNSENIGAVVIGRNEGERLKRCIQSLLPHTNFIVYVDSGSSDGSPEWVTEQGLRVVNLDLDRPFTAARARNEGFEKLRQEFPQTEFVQFIDGDCEIQPTWIKRSLNFMTANESIAVVCGRRREKHPDHSVYNALCDLEWNTPVGEAKACGGDSLMRAGVFEKVGGFRPDVIAGEEPELCFRIRQAGYKIWRMDEEMTLHDANITQFYQWWKRAQRAGYAYTLGASIHGKSPERYNIRQVARILIWAGCIPLLIVGLAFASPYFLLLAAIYPIQFARLLAKSPVEGNLKKHWAFYMVLCKFPEIVGVASFCRDRLAGKHATIIEYK